MHFVLNDSVITTSRPVTHTLNWKNQECDTTSVPGYPLITCSSLAITLAIIVKLICSAEGLTYLLGIGENTAAAFLVKAKSKSSLVKGGFNILWAEGMVTSRVTR